MENLASRLPLLLNLVLPLVLFMAWIYLALHMLFARLVTNPQSPTLWFFAVVTGPLTRPVRALLPSGTPEGRVRSISLAVYVGLWLLVRAMLVGLRSG
ncbi:MAG TPA: hypothetical protein VIF11_16460 [Methylomirabilota bacterium]|jgi:hypothetical protein